MEWASILSSAGSISKNGSSHVDLISSEKACVSMLYKKAQQYSTQLIVTCPNAKFYVYCRPQWTIIRTIQACNVQFMSDVLYCICLHRKISNTRDLDAPPWGTEAFVSEQSGDFSLLLQRKL